MRRRLPFIASLIILVGLTLIPATVHFARAASVTLPPGSSLSAAYRAASCGDTLQLQAGTYGAQTFNFDASKAGCASRVVIQGAPNLGSVVNGIDMNGAQHLEFVGIKMAGELGGNSLDRNNPTVNRTADVVFRDGSIRNFAFTSVDGLALTGNEVGNFDTAQTGGINLLFGDGPAASKNVLMEGNVFRNITSSTSTHAECLFIKAVDGLTIRNNKFLKCPGTVFGIYDASTGYARNVLIENNFMSCGGLLGSSTTCYGGGRTIDLDSKGRQRFDNWTIRYNSARQGWSLSISASLASNFRVYGNAVRGMSCPSGGNFTADYNVGVSCGGTNSAANPKFVLDADDGDFHAPAGAPQINAVPMSVGGPAADIDGDARPAGPAFDAGADEIGASDPPPPTTTTTPPPPTTTTTTTTTPPPPPYDPACATTCDEQIADLKRQLAEAQAALADVRAQLDAANADKASLHAKIDALQAKIDAALSALAP